MSTGAVKSRAVCRLSPNEEAALLRQQKEERRKARLLQVREQEKSFAKKVRDNVKAKKEEERRTVEEHLQAVLAASEEAERHELEARYHHRQKQIGQGHRQAQHIVEEENRLLQSKLHLKAEQRWQAKQRHNAAMRELTTNQLRELEAAQHPMVMRKRALAVEKERARHIAVNKPHPTQPLIKDFAVGKGHKVQLKEAEGFASTYYNIPATIVQRVTVHHHGKPNAQDMAEATTKQDESFMRHSSAAQQEQQEKAWLRHKHALAKVKLEREKADVISQLKTLEREDRTHRQKSLAKMPANMFQHTQRRVEIGCEQQRDMEQAFEGLFVKTHGVHNHPTLSRIASATQQASSPSPSDTSQSTTTEDQPPADSQHNDHPAEEKPPQSLTERQPSASTGDSKSSSEGAGSTLPRPSLSLEDPLVLSPKPQAGLRDPSLPSITMLSSDISSIQPREASVVQSHPFPVSSRLTGVPHKATPDASVRVPFGELEPSDGSFESTGTSTATSESTAASDGNPPLFQRVAPLTGFNTAGLSKTNLATPNAVDAGQLHEQPSVTVSDVTASDVQDLTSTTSKSITSGSSDASSGNDGETRPPIKGILKHTLPGEQRTSAVAPSIPPGKGGGMQRLVTMIRAQHQAWSERLAARASLLQSTLVCEQDSAPPPPGEALSASNQNPRSSSHDQDVGEAMHHQPTSSHGRVEGVATHPYHYPCPSSHDHKVGGANTSGPPTATPTVSQHDSLSIFTLSTRDSTRSPESDVVPNDTSQPCRLPCAVQDEGLESTVQSEGGALSPEPLSITQYHTTADTLETSSQPPAPQQGPQLNLHSDDDVAAGVHSPYQPPTPAATSVIPPAVKAEVAVDPAENTLSVSQPAGVRFESERHSRTNLSPSPTSALAPFHSNWTRSTYPFTTTHVPSQYPFQFHHNQYPFPFHQGHPSHPTPAHPSPSQPHTPQPLSSPLPCPHTLQNGNQAASTAAAAVFAVPTPKSLLLSPSPFSYLPPSSTKPANLPPDFRQLSFATPVGVMADSQTTQLRDLSLRSTASESPLQLGTVNPQHLATPMSHSHAYSLEVDVSDHRGEPKPDLSAAILRPSPPQNTNMATYMERPKPTVSIGVMHTQPPLENLSIVTLETSHTHSESPTDPRSPSPSASSSSSSEEGEEDSTSQPKDDRPRSFNISLPKDIEGDSNHSSSSENESDESERESGSELGLQEEGVDHVDTVQQHPLPPPSSVIDDIVQVGAESMRLHVPVGEAGELGATGLGTCHELKHGSSDTDSSEESDSSSNSNASHHELLVAASPGHSPGSTASEKKDPMQPNSPTLEDISGNTSESGITEGGTQPLTLQEAFLRRKEQFVLKSQDRLRQLKVSAQKRQIETSPTFVHSTPRLLQQGSGRSLKPSTPPKLHQLGHGHSITKSSVSAERRSTNANQSQSGTGVSDARKRGVTFSSPLAVPQDTGKFSPPRFLGAVSGNLAKPQPVKFLSSQKREKIRRKEMKERNMRFYNKLPEVKRQREEEKRKQAYSTNREKAKEYQQKLRIRVKQLGEKKRENSSQPVSKTNNKRLSKRPPFR